MEFAAGLPPDFFALVDPQVATPEPMVPADPSLAPGTVALPFAEALRDLQALAEGGEALPRDGNALPVAVQGRWPVAASQPGMPTPLPSRDALPAGVGASGADRAEDFTASASRVLERHARPVAAQLASGVASAAQPRLQSAASEAALVLSTDAAAGAPASGSQLPGALALPAARLVETAAARRAVPSVAAGPPAAAAQAGSEAPAAPASSGDTDLAIDWPAAAAQAQPDIKLRPEVAPPGPGTLAAAPDSGLSAAAAALPVAAPATLVPTPAQLAAQEAPAVPVRAEDLAGQIRWMVNEKVGEAKLRLHPPELGSLEIKVSLVDDKAHVQMVVQQSGARDLLEQHLPRLRELLAASGMDLGGATVAGGRDGQPAPRQAAEAPFEAHLDPDNEPLAQAASRPAAEGTIDLYA